MFAFREIALGKLAIVLWRKIHELTVKFALDSTAKIYVCVGRFVDHGTFGCQKQKTVSSAGRIAVKVN